MQAIKWTTKEVEISKIKFTKNNFKLVTEEGSARFKTSVDSYGLAGAVIINTDYELIDGNTRLKKAIELGHKKISASIPSRKLTPREFSEFSAMYDMARAGEVDVLRIKQELGTTNTFFKKWGLEMPKAALDKLAEMERNEAVVNPTASRKIAEEAKEVAQRPITLVFTTAEATEYLKLGESLYKKYKVDNITDLSLKIMKLVSKIK